MQCHPCILGGPKTKGDKIRIGCPTTSFSGPKRGRKCYITPAFSGIPKHMGTKSEVASNSITKFVPVSSVAPEGWGPKEGGNAT